MDTKSYVSEQNIGSSTVLRKLKPLMGWLDIELTERCNNNCIHCYINLRLGPRGSRQFPLVTTTVSTAT